MITKIETGKRQPSYDLGVRLAALYGVSVHGLFDERVTWLQDEHALPHGYASAIVHEHDVRRRQRSA